eukprot:4902653-Amphidinium_carterae.2
MQHSPPASENPGSSPAALLKPPGSHDRTEPRAFGASPAKASPQLQSQDLQHLGLAKSAIQELSSNFKATEA